MLLAIRPAKMLVIPTVCRSVPMLDVPPAKMEPASAWKATKLISTPNVSPALDHIVKNLHALMKAKMADACAYDVSHWNKFPCHKFAVVSSPKNAIHDVLNKTNFTAICGHGMLGKNTYQISKQYLLNYS
jgi:hypothetical protein